MRTRGRPEPSRSEGTVLLFVFLVLASGFIWVILQTGANYAFAKQGISNHAPLNSLPLSTWQSKPSIVLQFGRFSPNDGIDLYLYSGDIVAQVEITTLEGSVLYQDNRNGIFATRVFPEKVTNLTLVVAPVCGSNCKWSGFEEVLYTAYSRSPYFEVKIASLGSWTTVVLVAVSYHFRHRLAVKRLTKLVAGIAPPIAAFFLSWYFSAFGFDMWTVVYPTILCGFALGVPILYSVIPKD